MRRMVGAIPRGLRDHRTLAGHAYREYVRSKLARYPALPPDARPWLKAAGLIVLDLDQLASEAETVRAVLSNGVGRRARDKARTQLRQLERRAARLRGQLADAEARLEALAGERKQPDLARAIAEAQAARGQT
jgi:hypothetical protein